MLATSVDEKTLDAPQVVRSYQQLKEAERAFTTLTGPILEIRPIAHRLADRVKAHVFLCMLAYYLTWHLKQAWAELLFKDEHPPFQTDPVAKATRSSAAERKARTKRTSHQQPAHWLPTLLKQLATQTRNTIRLHGTPTTIEQLTTATELQRPAHQLIEQEPALE